MSLQEQMTALANEVRRLTGVSDKMSLSRMAEKLKTVELPIAEACTVTLKFNTPDVIGQEKCIYYTKVENGNIIDGEYETNEDKVTLSDVALSSVLWVSADGVVARAKVNVEGNAGVLSQHNNQSGCMIIALYVGGTCTLSTGEYVNNEWKINENGSHNVSGYDTVYVDVSVPCPDHCSVYVDITDAFGCACHIRYIRVVDGVADLVDDVVQIPFTLDNVMAGSVLWLETEVGAKELRYIVDTIENGELLENRVDGDSKLRLTILVNGDCTISQTDCEESILEITEDKTCYVHDINVVKVNNAELAGLVDYYTMKTTDLVLPKSVTLLVPYAFNGQYSMTSVELGNVETIYSYCFYGCNNLTEVYLPKVKTLGNRAFGSCASLKTVTFGSTPSSIHANTFGGCTGITFNCPWSENAVANFPWGATDYTVNYNYVEG